MTGEEELAVRQARDGLALGRELLGEGEATMNWHRVARPCTWGDDAWHRAAKKLTGIYGDHWRVLLAEERAKTGRRQP